MTNTKSPRTAKRLLVLVMIIAMLASFAVPAMAAETNPPDVTYKGDLTIRRTWVQSTSNPIAIWEPLNSDYSAWQVDTHGRVNGSRIVSLQPTLQLTNSSQNNETKTLEFSYSYTTGGDAGAKLTITSNNNGTSYTTLKTVSEDGTGTFSIELKPGKVVRVVASSGSIDATTVSHAEVSDLKWYTDTAASTTFLPAENGSYTVDGAAITAETALSKDAAEGYAVAATPAEGYQFYAWYEKNSKQVLSTSASTTLSIDIDSTVTALFVPSFAPGEEVFGVEMETGYVPFVKFDDAAGFAAAMGRPQVTLLKDYTLTESITIPDGVTLLVPFDAARTMYTEAPEIDMTTSLLGITSPTAHVTPSAFRTLTMAPGVSITVENGGGLSLSGKISAVGTGEKSYNGTPTGPDGRIVMQGDSTIEVKNGGSLYAYGYISGSGSVLAKSGAKVYECFQIRNWRGGNATLGMASSDVFPVSMYYVQNIEVPLTLEAGAEEIARSAVNASSTAMGAGVTFIGEGGMFQVTDGSVTKEYVPATDRLEITLDGDASVTSIALVIPEMAVMLPGGIDSANFALPINNNITVNCAADSEVQIDQDMAMLPGSVLNIGAGATVTLSDSTEVYVYDADEYVGKGYVSGHDGDGGVDFIPVGYSASNGTAAVRSNADLVDAKINIDGTVVVNGGFYTTESGAAIVSDGMTGKVVFTNGAGTLTTTHQATQSGNVASIKNVAITSAQLQNGDGSYVLTTEAVAGDEYPYSAAEDKWLEPFHGITITFDATGGEGVMDALPVTEDEAADGVELPESGFTRPGFEFVGWSEFDDATPDDTIRYDGDMFYPADEFPGETDITLYAIWEEQAGTYTVTFNANGGEGTMDPQVITADEPTALNANAFTREGYNFLYWSDSANGNKLFEDGETVTGEDDVTLYAIWQKDHYTLTFHSNFDPDQTTTQDVPLNADSITLKANTFEREGYEFLGWAFDPNATSRDLADGATLGFDEDTDLYAVWAKNTFQISFDANGGEGEMLPINVVKEVSTPLSANAFTREGYDFIGWATEPNGQIWFEDEDPILTDAVDDFTLYAQWQVKEYTITFVNDDNTPLQSFTIEHGQTPEYTGAEPAKDADAQYTYTFSGWTPAIVAATADATYTAKYVRTLNQYTVRFVDEDGTELQSSEVGYGTLPRYEGENPTKESTAQYDYTFAGWTPAIASVTGDQTYTATYTETVRSYTVTWVDGDGNELKVDTVDFGTVPTYTGATPTKAATAQYTYTHSGWTPEVAAVTGDVTYTATFTAETNKYTITFLNEDGAVLQSGEVAYGEVPTAPADPTKEATAQCTYTFAGWTPEIVSVTGDATYTATFTETVNTYTVTWKNEDGTLLETDENVPYGADPSYDGETPVKAADAQYTYTFSAWDNDLTPVTGDVTYTAVFSSTVNTYTIKWLAEDGSELEVDENVPYGETPSYDGETPTKAQTDETVYAFSGWTPEVTAVTGDASYTVVFTSSDRLYDVQWLNEDGSVLETQSGVKFDDELTYPGTALPTKEGDAQYSYTFNDWTRTVEGDVITMRASYTQTVNTYTVTWIVEGSVVETDSDVPFGTVPSYDGDIPTKSGDAQHSYSFSGWDNPLEAITGDVTFTAQFTESVNQYTVTFNANGGNGETPARTVDYGTDVALTSAYNWDGHIQTGWNTAADGSGDAYALTDTLNVTADVTLYAQWAPDGWVRDDNGIQFYRDGEALRSGWTQLDDGNWYYFDPDSGYAATGYAMVPYAPAETGNTYGPYEVDLKAHPEYAEAGYAENGEFVFDENGVFQLNQTGKILKDGSEWWCQNGEILWHARLVTDGTNYYYGSAGGALKRSITDWIGDTNDLLPAGTYTFADDGHIIMYNGIVKLDDGKWYYENGRRTYGGLIQEGGYYYYATSDGSIVCGKDFYVTKTNGIIDAGVRTFDEEGRMILNGLIEMDGELWYFEDGVKTGKGLVKVGDDYYYIKQNGAAVRGADYYVTKTNDLMEKGLYTFGDDGKMVIPETTDKNGLIWEDGSLWYYVDNVRTHAGLIYVDGYYYYIKTNGEAVRDTRYFVSNTNDLMPRAYHTFDDQGRMTDVPTVKNGLVEENGKLWYYENGEKAHPGLIQIDGDYYYICTSGYAIAGCDYYVSNTNGLLPKGTYTFADDGKMVVPETATRNGLVEEDGTLWYYVDGVKTHAGLIVIDGNYYYIKSNGSAVRDCDYFISDTNGLMERGTHHFNADGTMVL